MKNSTEIQHYSYNFSENYDYVADDSGYADYANDDFNANTVNDNDNANDANGSDSVNDTYTQAPHRCKWHSPWCHICQNNSMVES